MKADISRENAGRADSRASETRGTRTKRILIADDDSDFSWVLSRVLGPFARRIDVVCNGCEAVEQIQRQQYDAVLMDMHMPCKDGLEALRELRRIHKKMQVIILTLAPTAEMIREAYRTHADDFFVKPVFIEDMEALFERLVIRIWGLDHELAEADLIDGFWQNLKSEHEEEANT